MLLRQKDQRELASHLSMDSCEGYIPCDLRFAVGSGPYDELGGALSPLERLLSISPRDIEARTTVPGS